MSDFGVFVGNVPPHRVERWPEPPPWRRFDGKVVERTLQREERGGTFRASPEVVELVNAAIHLRRPMLVTGKPGTGKSSLARAIAHELELGELLVWPVNSRSTLQEGLYQYDAVGRLQDVAIAAESARAAVAAVETPDVGQYIRLGPLGTALLPAAQPRVLLIDEIDKSDIDLPNDLLHVFEEGEIEIPELTREAKRRSKAAGEGVSRDPVVMIRPHDGDDEIPITRGRIRCQEFPIVVLTSNGEREFPPAFKRRCIRIEMPELTKVEELERIVEAHFSDTDEKRRDALAAAGTLIESFLERRNEGDLATDQLLNAIRLRMGGADLDKDGPLLKALLRPLSGRS